MAADPRQGEQLRRCPFTTGSGCTPAGGSRRCRARCQMGNLASPEMLPRPAGSVESHPSRCQPAAAGRGGCPTRSPRGPGLGLQAANAAMVEVTCRGSKAGNLGFPPQKYKPGLLAGSPSPRVGWGWHGVTLCQGSTKGLRGTQSHRCPCPCCAVKTLLPPAAAGSPVPKPCPPQGHAASRPTALRTNTAHHTLPAGTAAPCPRDRGQVKPKTLWDLNQEKPRGLAQEDHGVGLEQRPPGTRGDERGPAGDQDSP